MLDKSFHFVCFLKIFLILSVSHHFCLVFGKKSSFLLKIAYIDGKQTNQKIFKKNEMFECLRCFYIPWLYLKLQIGTNYDCSNTRRWWGKWRNFRIFSKKAVIYTKLLLFFEKIRKFLHFPHHRRVFEQS